MEPLSFEFAISEFDLDLLPIDAALLRADRALLEKAVVDYLSGRFKPLGGRANIAIKDDQVAVTWLPSSLADHEKLFDYTINLLEQGAYKQAEPILRALLKHGNDNGQIALNLGMMLSDQQRLDEAIELLRVATSKMPDSANAWNALGVAYQRQSKPELAVEALQKSHDLSPDNPCTLRNLGALLSESAPEVALGYLRRAAELLPKDQASLYGFALALLRTADTKAADETLKKAIDLAPFTQLAEHCRKERTRIAQVGMRERGGKVRMDVVMYILSALQLFEKVGKQKTGTITFEIALLGRGGLDINDSTQKYSLKSLQGKFSGLHLLALMYTGLKEVAPYQDPGVDFSKEYAQATKMKDVSNE
jgi:tetratricopeptide (TPR) repeat protein